MKVNSEIDNFIFTVQEHILNRVKMKRNINSLPMLILNRYKQTQLILIKISTSLLHFSFRIFIRSAISSCIRNLNLFLVQIISKTKLILLKFLFKFFVLLIKEHILVLSSIFLVLLDKLLFSESRLGDHSSRNTTVTTIARINLVGAIHVSVAASTSA